VKFYPSASSCMIALALFGAQVAPSQLLAKEKDAPAKIVDSGSFGVFNGAHRVATETFSITEQGEQKAAQSSELDLTGSVNLRHYEWKELIPDTLQATVDPNDSFLIERFSTGADGKLHDQNFLLPASTSILDDYFFIQREVLAWKFLATVCKQQKAGLGCPPNQKAQFGTLNPHARSSMLVSIEFSGKDKVTVRGAERDLSRFMLRSETGDWAMWLDDSFKIVRLLGDNGIEVVRD
jgi:hypothetical protein